MTDKLTAVEMIEQIVTRLAERDCDVLAYFGDIDRRGADRVLKLTKKRTAKKNIVLMLATFGGDANAAYRIARTLQNKYGTRKQFKEKNDPSFSVFVPTYCKSAGTILALGADRIIMSPEAELGPIDVQLRKPDEVGELTSGLTPNQAIRSLARHSEDLFKSLFRKLRFDTKLGFSTKMASEIASTLTSGLLTPIFAQLDPLRLAETERMLEISVQYGKRLAISNLRGEEALARLVNEYPSHGFVIDLPEAREIFRSVIEPDDDLLRLAELFELTYSQSMNEEEGFIHYIEPSKKPEQTTEENQSDATESKAENSHAEHEGTGSESNGGTDGPRAARAKRSFRRDRSNPGTPAATA